MVAVGGGSGYKFSIMILHKPSYVFLVTLSTRVLSELKTVTSLFVKSAKKLESQSCLIERRLALLRLGYVCVSVAVDSNIGRGRCS